MLLTSIIAAIIPAAIYVALIYWADRYEKEPTWLLIATFVWGAVPAVIVALIFNTLFGLPFYIVLGEQGGEIATATFVAPVVEEITKGAALLIILLAWRHQIDSLLDGIIYGAMVGMGFAMVENVFYFVNVWSTQGVEAFQFTFILRVIVFGFNHSLFSAMTGLGIAYARIYKESGMRWVAPFLGLFLAMFLHFVHNGSASIGSALACIPLLGNAWGGLLVTFVIIGWSWRQEHRWMREYLAPEIEAGNITRESFDVAISGRARFRYYMKKFGSHGIRGVRQSMRYFNSISKMAYLLHHQDWYHDEGSAKQMELVRAEIANYREVVGV